MIVVVMVGYGHTNVHRRKQGENIGLNTSYQQLNQINEQHNKARKPAYYKALKHKSQTDKAEQYDVPGSDGHKQTDGERNRLGEYSNDFNRQNNRPQGQRHTGGPKNVAPISAVATHIGNNKSENSQG